MSTPYRIEYKGIISIANGYNGYPRDVLQEIIPYDLSAISNNKDKWLAELALEQNEYYGTKIDNYGEYPAEYTYIVESNNNNEFEVTIYNHSKKIAMINLAKLSEMPANKYEIMIDEINYSCECLDVRTKDMIESFGHKIYVEVNYLV
ncbi:hypothetical protein N5T98_03520 [Aliarcobacter cryaerophilus]|uniref:hypothetical protein n=1 Tax=Aliarcobacter cryaerophilus TaxID=28198 RepID=UPI0021B5021C|nr:hypothetical protein [Aliarcobacter cryaerophilus]MCT7485685.1 hypothetical protein [Aliarcobacter cryaerophilus]MCT7490158.1 hypothetical protein [Aliarcobacter cryaerophilus]